MVHTAECSVGKRLFERDSERWMRVEWAEEPTRPFETGVIVLVQQRQGRAGAGGRGRRAPPRPTSRTSTWATSRASETTELKLLLSVRDRLHLADVMRTLQALAGGAARRARQALSASSPSGLQAVASGAG